MDHQYTPRGLAWSRLKSADLARAGALREVASRMDCEISLALADVHESWSCEDDGAFSGRRARDRWQWRRQDSEDDDASEEFELIDLLDSGIELRHWVPLQGRLDGVSASVDEAEVCFTMPSNEFPPFASEHEGYMGNYGNTVDRWYHRAAVVLWPRERTFVMHARMSPRWAVDEIAGALRQGDVDRARDLSERLTPFWREVAPTEQSRGFFERTLGMAVGLDNPDLAAAVLQPFTLERVTPRAAPKLVALVQRYGFPWFAPILAAWRTVTHRDPGIREAWTASLPSLCRPLTVSGSNEGSELARRFVADRWAAIVEQWNEVRNEPSPKGVLDAACDLSRPLIGLIEASVLLSDSERHDEILRTLLAPATGFPMAGLVHLLRAAHHGRPGRDVAKLALAPVHEHCAQALGKLLSGPPRDRDDWSIPLSRLCTCRLCGTLAQFLRATTQRQLEWPLAKNRRAHIHGVIDAHDLPVSHVTRREGSPFTLVLTKTEALFEREAAERGRWYGDLRWLTKTAGVF